MKILIVEDIHVMALVLNRQLEALGYRDVQIARSAEEALRLVTTTPFSLFIVDWVLPGASGLDLVKMLRSIPYYEAVPILIVSGNDTFEEVVQAIQAGANDYIVKPVQQTTLKSKLDKLIPSLPEDALEKKSTENILSEKTGKNEENEVEKDEQPGSEAPKTPLSEDTPEKKLDTDGPNGGEKSNI